MSIYIYLYVGVLDSLVVLRVYHADIDIFGPHLHRGVVGFALGAPKALLAEPRPGVRWENGSFGSFPKWRYPKMDGF